MDVARRAPAAWPRRAAWAATTIAALAAVTGAFWRLRPAAPQVERASVWVNTVKRGVMVRQVRGNGTLVPEEIRWVTATSAARVERILLLPGVAVTARTVLLELANPELQQAVLDLAARATAAEAQLTRLKLQLEGDELAQASTVASLQSDLALARSEAEGDEGLAASGYGPAIAAMRSRARANELARMVAMQGKRSEAIRQSSRSQLLVQRAEIARLRAEHALRRQQLDALQVRAGIDGVLQRLGDEQPIRVGQQIAVGAVLARIANQKRLKAEIKIPETQAKDVQIGQSATLDTRNGMVDAHVTRIDPAVQNATVTVDVVPDGPWPPGARPDLNVEGTITLERIPGVLHVERPVGIAPESRAGLFKLVEGGRAAVRVAVRLGRSSIDAVEIVEGLEAGDQVIISDASPWDSLDRISFR